MIRIMDKMWLKEGEDLKMVTFGCVPTGDRQGMIELITEAKTLREIQVRELSKPSLKIETANAIFWNSLGLFRDYDLNYTFLGNETFFVFQDRKPKFLVSEKKGFR